MSYKPQPIDTSHVTLSAEIRQLIERLAENTHDHWARQRFAEGWTYGPARDEAKKEHPGLVPYALLAESEKQYDRTTALETLKVIMALGYRLEKLGAHTTSAASPVAAGEGEGRPLSWVSGGSGNGRYSLRSPSAHAVAGERTATTDSLVESILQQVNAPGANILALLEQYQSAEYAAYWQQDLRLARAFGRALIRAGHPTRGFELIRADLEAHKDDPAWHDDPELQYLRAWALARGGNASKATEYVEQLLQVPALAPPIDVDAASLAGRLYKDRYERTTTPSLKASYAAESAARYTTAYHRRAEAFPCINAATMSLLAGQPEQAQDFARRALAQVAVERQQPGREHDHWLLATLGEAHLLLGDQTEAARWYGQAVRQAAGQIGDIASMRRQLQLLAQKLEIRADILDLFDIGHVVVFSGHMIDHPTRVTEGQLPPRFPPDTTLEDRVRRAIREALNALNATVGYSSAACGSDILFAEQMLEHQKELHIVLPFNAADFYATSVDFGLAEMSQWRKRCDHILAHATEVHYATTESFLGDEVLFEFVNTFTQGLAITRAAQLGVEPYALAVHDPAAPGLFGGTTYFLHKWQADGYPMRAIDLAALRSQPRSTPLATWGHTVLPHPTIQLGTLKRQV